MSPERANETYVSGARSARVLGCPPKQVPVLAARGFLTVRHLPGCDPRYLLSDVQRLASQYTQPASALEGE